MKRGAAAMLAAFALAAHADEREQIRAERQAADARYEAAAAVCRERFVIASCLEEAQAERRVVISRLRKQELALDTAERKQRAADRTAQIEAKKKALRERQAQPVAPAPPPVERAGSQPAPSLRVRQPRPVAPQPSAAERAANEAAYERRQRDAEQHRQDVERRNRERAAKQKPAASLPVPAASDIP